MKTIIKISLEGKEIEADDIREELVLCKDKDGYFIGNLCGGKLPSRNMEEPFFIKIIPDKPFWYMVDNIGINKSY